MERRGFIGALFAVITGTGFLGRKAVTPPPLGYIYDSSKSASFPIDACHAGDISYKFWRIERCDGQVWSIIAFEDLKPGDIFRCSMPRLKGGWEYERGTWMAISHPSPMPENNWGIEVKQLKVTESL